MLVAAVIFGGDTQTLAGKTIFFNFQFQLAYIFSIFHSNFFKFASLKFKKKNRASRDVRLAFKLAREHVSLLFISKHFLAQFLFFPTFNSLFFQYNFGQFYLVQFSFFDLTRVKRKILQIVLRISIFHLRKFTCEFCCSSETSEITFPC